MREEYRVMLGRERQGLLDVIGLCVAVLLVCIGCGVVVLPIRAVE